MNKEKMIEFVNECKDVECCVIATNCGCYVNGAANEVLTLITTLINQLKDRIPKDAFKKCIDYAYLSDEELQKETEKAIKKKLNGTDKDLSRIKEILKMLEDLDNE